jgi:hypothetical protein
VVSELQTNNRIHIEFSVIISDNVDVLGNIRQTFSSNWPCDLAKENGSGIVFILDHVI